MKKNIPFWENTLADDRIDQYCSGVENLLQNLKTKRNKSQNNDYLLNQNFYDEFQEDI